VYELGIHGSLADCLVNDEKAAGLTWKLRIRISNGLAKALNYLHKHGDLPVFHRDIKSSNAVLCNSGMLVKLIDCGLSMLLKEEQVEAQQSIFTVTQGGALGTPGYMCPQFTRTRKYGEKSEVYSLGVVLLELLTGKVQMVDDVDLIELFEEADDPLEALLAALDSRSGGWHEEVAAEFAALALECVNHRHSRRPAMLLVLRRLSALETKFCRPTLEELRLDTLAEEQRTELEALRLQAQLAEATVASAMLTCVVCYDGFEKGKGLCCAEEHFVCGGCFNGYAQSEGQTGQVLCPEGNHGPAFTEHQVARHVTDEVYTLLRARSVHLAVSNNVTVAAVAAVPTCAICLDEPADHLVTPCGHQCGCEGCLTEIQQSNMPNCPICRTRISTVQRVFNSMQTAAPVPATPVPAVPVPAVPVPAAPVPATAVPAAVVPAAAAAPDTAATLEGQRRLASHAPPAPPGGRDRDFALALQRQEQDARQIATLQRQLQEHERRQAEQQAQQQQEAQCQAERLRQQEVEARRAEQQRLAEQQCHAAQWTTLHDAVCDGDVARVREIIEKGDVYVDQWSSTGRQTPLYCCVIFGGGNLEIATLLLEAGARRTLDNLVDGTTGDLQTLLRRYQQGHEQEHEGTTYD
jgi:interleukin-1 receptor-associated kinase 4